MKNMFLSGKKYIGNPHIDTIYYFTTSGGSIQWPV